VCVLQSARGVLHEREVVQGTITGLLRQKPTVQYVLYAAMFLEIRCSAAGLAINQLSSKANVLLTAKNPGQFLEYSSIVH